MILIQKYLNHVVGIHVKNIHFGKNDHEKITSYGYQN